MPKFMIDKDGATFSPIAVADKTVAIGHDLSAMRVTHLQPEAPNCWLR